MIGFLQQTAPAAVETTIPAESHATGHDAATAVIGADGVATAHDAAAASAAAHAAPTGLPQLDVTTFANQIFWLVLTMLLLYWVLSRVALPRIGGVIADRQGAITGDLGAAEEFKRRARDAEAAYDKALAEARSEAQGIIAQNRAAMQGELDTAIAHADAEISARASESERRIGEIQARAIEDARTVAREVTGELVSAFGGRADPEAISSAVDQQLKGAAQ